MGASPYPEQWPPVKVFLCDAPHGPSLPSFLFLPHLVLPLSCQPRVDTLGPALGFPHSWRARVTEVYEVNKQPARSILWDNQTVIALPAVGSGKGNILCLPPSLLSLKAFGGAYLFLEVSMVCLSYCLYFLPAFACVFFLDFIQILSWPQVLTTQGSMWDLMKGLGPRSCVNTTEFQTFLFLKALGDSCHRQVLSSGLGGEPRTPLLPPSKSALFLRLACAPKPHKTLFSSYVEQFCSLCLIPASFKVCPKDSFHSWKGTSGSCVSPNRDCSEMNSATSY